MPPEHREVAIPIPSRKKKEKRPRMTREKLEKIPEMIHAGLTYRQIAYEFKVTDRTVYSWVAKLRKAGRVIDNPRGPKPLVK